MTRKLLTGLLRHKTNKYMYSYSKHEFCIHLAYVPLGWGAQLYFFFSQNVAPIFPAKTIDRLLQLPLTTKEEQLLVSYLMDSSEPRSQEMLVMHYLQKARFTEAIQLNDKLKHAILVSPSTVRVFENGLFALTSTLVCKNDY